MKKTGYFYHTMKGEQCRAGILIVGEPTLFLARNTNKGGVPINKGFVSSSLDENVANHFAVKTSSVTKNLKVIRRITSQTGVYVDDLSDYGGNLGNIRHSDSPSIERIQKEVLMEEGLFKQLSDPTPFKGPDDEIWYYIDFLELGKPLK